jgi:hypothetical protein
MDALSETGGAEIVRFRSVLGGAHLAGIFHSPDNLASLGAPAVAIQGMNRHMAERALKQDQVGGRIDSFVTGSGLYDSTIQAIQEMVSNAGSTRAMVIDLGTGDAWWSTRLYLLATLLQSLTGVRQLVFTHPGGRFAGMASPAAVRDGLCRAFPEIANFDSTLRNNPGGSEDTEREIARCVGAWNTQMSGIELTVKVGVRWPLVVQWLGERLITRCITLDAESGLTTAQAQKIIESLIPDVPVEQQIRSASGEGDVAGPSPQLMVVDRDAFALEVAREWVQTGLPRER